MLEKEPERLSSVPGITRAKAKKIAEEFRSVFGIRELMVYLGGTASRRRRRCGCGSCGAATPSS